MFLGIIIISLVLILFVIPLIIFSPWLKNKPQDILQEQISQPNITINLDIIDSDRVKNLEPFGAIETEFSYIAEDKGGKKVQGSISALSKDEAIATLEKAGFKILSLQEVFIGKKEPFTPYYQ